VTFIADSVAVDVPHGENLLRAAMAADVHITAPCGGGGTCGKCRMIIESGSVRTRPSSRLSAEEQDKGYVLACVSEVVEDIEVSIPPEARPGAAPTSADTRRVPNAILSAEERAERVPEIDDEPPVLTRVLRLDEPSLTDNASDLTRVQHALRRTHSIEDAHVSLDTVRSLPGALREGEWDVSVFIAQDCDGTSRVCGFLPGTVEGTTYVAAVDVGTTTIEVALVDVSTGEVVAQGAEYNDQVALGEDVITRVIAGSSDEGLADLQDRVAATIARIMDDFCKRMPLDATQISCYVAAGNTVMTQLLLGVTPENIRSTPYVPAATSFPWTDAASVGLPGHPGTQLITMPCPASWLGGDIVAGVLASGMPWSDHLTLLVDIGTNGEIVLGNKDWLVACSCSAGPAFEGAGISHGMRAAKGAIEQVRIDAETLEPMILTIAGSEPIGICGSGLIDCVSELFLSEAIGRDGLFARENADRIRESDTGREYVLVWAEESGIDGDIVISETDIENLMRAKAAIHSGIEVLLESVDVTIEQVDEVIVAGGFGHYLDLEQVTTLGMVPEIPAERYRFIGNASLLGAELAARSQTMLAKAQEIAEMVTYIELSVNASFMDMYVSSLFLPHTDLTLFPKTEELRAQRHRAREVV
jgi:uncharacterized 2Fe-2S/4Fe-4S cluster protein (DUF4445 family)